MNECFWAARRVKKLTRQGMKDGQRSHEAHRVNLKAVRVHINK